VEQRAEQVQQSESVDMTAQIHGGWTMDNCLKAINEYCQKIKRPLLDYRVAQTDHGTSK
jgi:hypothetical protein